MEDSFDGKRSMVKKLMEMLKSHASNEVSTGLQHPEGEGDMHGIQAENVEMADHDMDHPTPEHDVVTHDLHEGGVVESVNKGGYKGAPEKSMPSGMQDAHPDKEGAVHKELGEGFAHRDALTTTEHEEPLDTEYEDAGAEPPSMFASFLGKRKKK